MKQLILRWFKGKKLYQRTALITLLVSMLIIALLGTFATMQIRRLSVNSYVSASMNNLKQAVGIFDIVLNQVTSSCQQTALSKPVRDFEQFQMRRYFEEMDSALYAGNEVQLYKYQQLKRELGDAVGVILLSNAFLDSVYYYDPTTAIVITDTGWYSKTDFIDQGWIAYLEQLQDTDTQIVVRPFEHKSKQFLTVFCTSYSDGVFIANVDAARLNQQLSAGINAYDRLFFVDASGEMLAGNAQPQMAAAVWGKRADSKTQGYYYADSGATGKQVVVYTKSDIPGVTAAIATDTRYMNAGYYRSVILLMILILILFSVVIYAVFIAFNRLYQPLYDIIDHFDLDTGEVENEFKLIEYILKKNSRKNLQLEEQIKEMLPEYSNLYLRKLIRQQKPDVSETGEKFREMGINVNVTGLTMMILGIDNLTEVVKKEQVMEAAAGKVLDVTAEAVSCMWRGVVFPLENGTIAVLVNCQQDEYSRLFDFASSLKEDVYERTGFRCTIGVSRYMADISTVAGGVEEADIALNRRIVTGGDDVIFIDDIDLAAHHEAVFPSKRVNQLCDCLKTGEKQRALETFDAVVEDITNQSSRLGSATVRMWYFRILSSLVYAAEDVKVDLTGPYGGHQAILDDLYAQHELGQIVSWFRTLIADVCAQTGEPDGETNSQSAREVLRIIEENGGNVTLYDVADQTGLNPSYISRMFKKNTGENFNDVITRCRVEQGKRLLASTQMKVYEIAEAVGYGSSYYFIKVFKATVGITPAEYRNFMIQGQSAGKDDDE